MTHLSLGFTEAFRARLFFLSRRHAWCNSNSADRINRRWYEANTGQAITDVQRRVKHASPRSMSATLGGRVEVTAAVFEAKFIGPIDHRSFKPLG
jgi:hypothetical protein